MRKLLMASAALLGASGGLALAQTAAPSQGQLAAPYGAGPAANNNNNAWGAANTPSGSTAAGPLSTIYAPNVDAVPAPGTIVIRLNGRVEADVVANFTSADRGISPSATGGAPNGFKINPVGVATYLRLYPGFDAMAANGLRYGAAAEIRTNYLSGITPPTSGGATGTGSQVSASGNTSGETLFLRRVFSYLAADQAGIVRIGQTDGVVGLFDNCVFSSSCWDAGVGTFQGGYQATTAIGAAGGGGTSWPWLAQAGNEYGNAKIVYLTPQFFGFDFGVQYAPSMGNAYQDNTQTQALSPTVCNQASNTCISVTSGDDAQRWYNQVGVGARYQQSFGAVDFKAYGFYETAGKEDLTTVNGGSTSSLAALKAIAAAPGTQAFRNGANANFYNYDNLSFYQAGVAVTALNFTAAVSYIGGAYDGQMSMRPTGGAPENAFLYGLTYANGPLTAGVDAGIIDSQGATQLVHTSQRHEVELGFGGAYRLAPGVQLVGEYQYVQRHQGGFDFNTGALGTSSPSGLAGSSTRDAHGQGFLFSTVMTW
jgi:hypothetical protein